MRALLPGAERLRAAVAVAGTLYVYGRFGFTAGHRTLIAAGLVILLDRLQSRPLQAGETIVRCAAAVLQVAVATALFVAPAPFGFGSDVPAPMMMETPLALLLLCLVASHALPAKPAVTACAGLTSVAAWFTVRLVCLSDPQTVTRDQLDVGRYKTTIDLVRHLNTPHYFNFGVWVEAACQIAIFSLVLAIIAYRFHRLARQVAGRVALRDALSAHFSPQVTELMARSRKPGLVSLSRDVAVLDCDLVGFSTLAAGLAPERIAQILAAYRAVVEDAVFAADGAIVAYAGDGAVAVFGLIDGGRPPACAALACIDRIASGWSASGKEMLGADPPPVAIGVDFGAVRAGLIGENRAASLLLLGAPMQGASRLQELTRDVASWALVSDAERNAAMAEDPDAAGRLRPLEIGGRTVWHGAPT